MTIESIQGRKKYRISPENKCMVQMQPKQGARWADYRKAASWTAASALVLELAWGPQEETQELEAVKE